MSNFKHVSSLLKAIGNILTLKSVDKLALTSVGPGFHLVGTCWVYKVDLHKSLQVCGPEVNWKRHFGDEFEKLNLSFFQNVYDIEI